MINRHIKGRIFIGMFFCVILGIYCSGCSSSSSDVTTPHYKTFVTAATFDGDIKTAGGQSTAIASADALCMADTNKPAGGGTYKALLVDEINRRACSTTRCAGGTSEHTDWVLKANTTYYRNDGTTPVLTTNANGIFDFKTDTAHPVDITNSFDDTATYIYWTGLDWPWVSLTSQMCGGSWSSNAGNPNNGDYGFSDRTDSSAIGGGNFYCDITDHHLLCVEQ
jgi:hypothetical protein